jgi:hypothetical protein
MNITDLIKQIIKPMLKPSALTVKVTAVNNDATFDCEPLNGSPKIFSVKIKPKQGDLNGVYMLFKPALNSIATIAMLDDNDSNYILIKAEEYESLDLVTTGGFKCEIKANGDVLLNDGTFGGLVKINDLKLQYDNNLTAIKTAVSSGLGVIDLVLGTTSAATFNTAANSIVPLNLSSLQNNKIKH